MQAETPDPILVEELVEEKSQSTTVIYLIWLVFGLLGGHRFYLGRGWSGMLMFSLLPVGLFLIAVVIGFYVLAFLLIWWIIDAFLILWMLERDRERLRQRIAYDLANPNEAFPDIDTRKWSPRDAAAYKEERRRLGLS